MREEQEHERRRRRGYGLKEEDKKQICEGFQEIERDLAFEVLESWRERKLDEFVVALENLQLLIEVSQKVCG